MTDVLVGDALLELAKAKELASVMGGAWHDAEDAESDSEQKRDATKVIYYCSYNTSSLLVCFPFVL